MLLCLLLFNWLGYRFVINYLQERADQQLETRIDHNKYNDSQLIEIRVALNMPYQAMNTSFERHYGEIEMGGKYYTYVKRKVEDGFLVLKCIPNHYKDVAESGKKAVPFAKVVKYTAADFDNDKPFYELSSPEFPGHEPSLFNHPSITPGFLAAAGQPPETV